MNSDDVEHIDAGSSSLSKREEEMASLKENINGSKKQSIIVSLFNPGPFSFPMKS